MPLKLREGLGRKERVEKAQLNKYNLKSTLSLGAHNLTFLGLSCLQLAELLALQCGDITSSLSSRSSSRSSGR